jgi:hypothetical protein
MLGSQIGAVPKYCILQRGRMMMKIMKLVLSVAAFAALVTATFTRNSRRSGSRALPCSTLTTALS